MKVKQIATMLATVLFAAMAFAGDQEHQKIEIKVISDDGDGATHLSLDSDDLGFNLHDLQVGENRSITDKEGRPILITRTDDGFSFDIDGKTIDMPAFDGAHESGNVWIMKGGHGDDVNVNVLHEDTSGDHTMVMDTSFPEGVMIISEKEIDDSTQQVIRTALESAGHESVNFAGGHGGSGPHGVHVIKKHIVEVEVTE
jgi:hypothetical protein